jgi:enoyl-[acyl-carrier protein] reductase I
MAYNLLKGKRGIIFGALDDQSIAWKVAERCVEEGARITLTNAPVALRFGKIQELGEKLGAEIIPADATSMEDLEKLIVKSIEVLDGTMDFVLHSIGMSLNVRKKREYTDLNYDWMHKTLDISAISFHRLMQKLYQLEAMSEWGSILALSYIAAQRTFPDYNEMAESKALLESFARSFGYHYAVRKKVRVNTISQSPTRTTAGSGVKGFDEFFEYADKMSPLGNASAEACADYSVVMFSDLTRMVTMQNLYHDGGFSSMGMNPAVLGL